MTTRFGWHGRLAVALGLTASLAVAAPAVAATTVRVAGGTTTLRLDAKTVRALRRAGIAVSYNKPARAKGAVVSFPISGGTIDPATAKGTLKHKGGLTLKAGKRKVALTAITLDSSKGQFTAKAGKKTVAFASVKGGKVTREGFATEVAGYKVAISKKGAAALNKALGGRAIKAGTKLGTAGSEPTSNEIALERGTTSIQFTAQVAGALGQLRPTITATAPATFDAATGTLTYPITGGTLNAENFFGTIEHDGTVTVSGVPLSNPVIGISASPSLTITNIPAGTLTIGEMPSVDPATRSLTVRNVGVVLNDAAAGLLNQALRAQLLRGGDTIATATLQGTAR
jgi:hypothetical protein